MTRRSPIERICEHMIFRVTHSKKRKPEIPPSQILTFNYTSHLADTRWLRERARRKHVDP